MSCRHFAARHHLREGVVGRVGGRESSGVYPDNAKQSSESHEATLRPYTGRVKETWSASRAMSGLMLLLTQLIRNGSHCATGTMSLYRYPATIAQPTKDEAMNDTRKFRWMVLPIALASLLGVPTAMADVVTDWNVTADDITVAAGLPPPPANRTLAMVQTAVYEAVNAITKRYPADRVTPNAAPDASVAAAVAAANRAMLSRLVPSQQAAIDKCLRGRTRGDRRRPGEDGRDCRRRTGRRGCSRVARRRRRGCARTVSASHDRRRLRPHTNSRRSAVAAAQAMGDDLVRSISARATPRTRE